MVKNIHSISLDSMEDPLSLVMQNLEREGKPGSRGVDVTHRKFSLGQVVTTPETLKVLTRERIADILTQY